MSRVWALLLLSITADVSAHEVTAPAPGSDPVQALDPSAASGRGNAGEDAVTQRTAASHQVEIVASREGTDLLLYIDDYASDAPITTAQVDLHQGARSLRAAPTADGRYRLPADGLDVAGPVTLSISGAGIEQSMPIALPPAALPIDSGSDRHDAVRWTLVLAGLSIAALFAIGLRRPRRRAAAPLST